jgi:hypothetical protein
VLVELTLPILGGQQGAAERGDHVEVVPRFVGFEVGSSPERLTWEAPRTAKSEEEDPHARLPHCCLGR